MSSFAFFMIGSGMIALLAIATVIFRKPKKKESWELHFVDGRVEGDYKTEKAAETALNEMGCRPFTATAVRKECH